MKKINKYIQLFLLALVPIGLLASIADTYYLVGILLLSLPIGATQYIGSLIDTLLNGKKSIYLWHTVLSTVVLLVIASITDLNFLFRADGIYESFAEFIGFGGSVGLAIYFWVITFSRDLE
ncbi:MAG: hypothetical protein ABF321_03495 [Bacteroidia bacterium]|jgi:hypothetical protein